MKILVEDSNLYKGIFWIKDLDDYDNNETYFQIPVDSDGNIIDYDNKIRLNSRNNDNYNHKLVWSELGKDYTDNKSFDYYPRGRVEISNGKATIYCNPNICDDNLKNWIINKFNLTSHNGIKKVTIHPDYSDHYRCYLDR